MLWHYTELGMSSKLLRSCVVKLHRFNYVIVKTANTALLVTLGLLVTVSGAKMFSCNGPHDEYEHDDLNGIIARRFLADSIRGICSFQDGFNLYVSPG